MAKSLSENQLKKLATLKREEGRHFLITALGWPEFDEDDDPQHSIHLDYLYDNLMFMINKGFSWGAITILFNVTRSAIQESIGKTLPETIQIFSSLTKPVVGQISSETLKHYTEYYFSTFMSHFKLYQYVFTNDRERQQINVTVPVEVPSDPAPFAEAKDVDIYEYEQKYKQLENAELEAQQKRFCSQEDAKAKDDEQMQKALSTAETVPVPLDREKILEIIKSVASAHVSSASHAIQQNISSTMEDLSFMLEKTALERPQALGTPPRYKPKTPLTAGSGAKKAPTREKSGTKSRLSTKGSKR